MDKTDVEMLKLVQDGIPLIHSPFRHLAAELGTSEQEVVDRLKNLQKAGKIRRFAASIGHRALGITSNAMCVWNVPNEQIEKVGAIMAEFSEVTHCYERPRYSDWPYNLFTMVHSYTHEDCEKLAFRISEATGIKEYTLFFSEREFKKTGVKL
jgi:DNA-binding Lrp family transcriptional regulator